MSYFASLYDPKNPSRSFTIGYLTALCIIGVLTMMTHFTTHYIIQKQEESKDVTYHISRTNGLVQRIPYHLQNYANYVTELDRGVLSDSIKDLTQSHAHILGLIAGNKTISSSLTNIYLKSNFDLNKKIQSFKGIINTCLEKDIKDKDTYKTCFIALEQLETGIITSIVRGLDVATENYRIETLEKIKSYKRIHISATFIVLMVLVLEAIFIFKPLIKKNASYLQTIRRLAMEDPLTKLSNRRAFNKYFSSYLDRQSRADQPVIMALMDLDKFKSVNDIYGHEVGDDVLVEFSKQLKKCLRKGDIIARIGGEEFVVVLTNLTDFDEAYRVIDRMRATVERTPCEYKDENGKPKFLEYTVSIGLVGAMAKDNTINNLLKEADKLLYDAKEAGRNCVVTDNQIKV